MIVRWLGFATAAVLVGASGASAGCVAPSECDYGESICRGASLAHCGLADNRHPPREFLTTSPCGTACVEWSTPEGRRAQCTLSEAKDTRCPAEGTSSQCEGNKAVSCNTGWVTGERQCPVVCAISVHGSAHCAVKSAIEPRCEGLQVGESLRCDGTSLLECADGLVTKSTPCAAPFGACRSTQSASSTVPMASCVSSAVDPLCRSTDDAWCDGSIAVRCQPDGRIGGSDCGRQGMRCRLDTLPSGAKLALCER